MQSRAHRDGSGSDQKHREKPGMVLAERADARGYGHCGGQGQGVPHVGSCPLPGPPQGCHCVATPTAHPTLSAPRNAWCSPRMALQPWEHFWVLSVPFMGQHSMKCRLDHGAVWKLRWRVIQYLAGASTTLSATDQVGAKPSETASGSGLTFAKFCMKYQFSTPFI